MAAVQSSKLRKHILKAGRIAPLVIAGVALLSAEIFVFENWGSRLGVRILGFVINIGGLVMMWLGLYRLKVAAESDPRASFWPGMRASFLGAMLMMGFSLGTFLHYQWHVPFSGAVENGF